MDLGIKGKVALVTGSTKGIGFSIARSLAQEGAEVIVNGRDGARTDEAAGRLRKEVAGARVRALAGDAGDEKAIKALAEAAAGADILVNNVGIFEPIAFAEATDEVWRRHFEVNVMGGVRLSRAALPAMMRRNWGRIVFISSESAVQIPSEMIHYGMTKTAQIAIARGLAELTAGTGVTVNSVLPGPTRSEGVEEFVGKLSAGKSFEEFEKEFFRSVRPTSLLKRFETTEEIAAVVAFVCGSLASSMNGAAVRAEGGIIKSAF